MWTRFLLAVFLAALANPCRADDKAVADIADGITSYRLSATFCHWPIPTKISGVLESDERHFSAKNRQAFNSGIKNAEDRFRLLTASPSDYCHEIEASRGEMTRSLEQRAK